MPLTLPPEATCSFAEIAWDAETLRALLATTLEEHAVSSADLLRAWDRNGDGGASPEPNPGPPHCDNSHAKSPPSILGRAALNRAEFLQRLRATFFSGADGQALWDAELCAAAEQAFVDIAGRHDTSRLDPKAGRHGRFERHIDVVELEQWLVRAVRAGTPSPALATAGHPPTALATAAASAPRSPCTWLPLVRRPSRLGLPRATRR